MLNLEGSPLAIFPCRPDKSPFTKHGFKDASTDPARIAYWWRRFPGALAGVPTGALNGFDVLDIDTKNRGEAWLSEFEATHGFPLTRCHQTRSGGMHFLFRHRPGLHQSYGLIAPGVDVRTDDKGYVIWWPAEGFRVLCEGPTAPWPSALIEALHEAEERRGAWTAKTPLNGPLGLRHPQADWKLPDPLYRKMPRITRPHYQRRVRGLLNTLVRKREGEHRNQALNDIAFDFRELIDAGVIDRADVEQLLFIAAEMNGHVAKRGDAQTRATIRSGLGRQLPCGPLRREKEKTDA